MATTQQLHHFTIPVLTASNYHDWRLACTTAAKQCLPTNGPLGGLGLLLPHAEFEELSGERYVLAAKPANVTNAGTTHLQVVYDRERVALGALQAAVMPPSHWRHNKHAQDIMRCTGQALLTCPP